MNTETIGTKPKRVRKPYVLPTKPSALICIGLKDLRKCESLPRKFEINMAEWLRVNGKCVVCLAGAVMANRLGGRKLAKTSSAKVVRPGNYDANKHQLRALNYFRCGTVDMAIMELRFIRPIETSIKNRFISNYGTPNFYIEMEKLAADFEKEGN